jgi:hypothetical protein
MTKLPSELKLVSRSVISDMFRVVIRLKRENNFRGSEIMFIMANVWRGSGDIVFENWLLEKAQELRRFEARPR